MIANLIPRRWLGPLLAVAGAAFSAPAHAADAPLLGPRLPVEEIHVVEQIPFFDAHKSEASLFLPVQVNPSFTWMMGNGLEYTYHVAENFGLHIGADYFWHNADTVVTEELLNDVHQQPFAADALLLQDDATLGLEMTPIYGKFIFFASRVVDFNLFLTAGVGLGQTRVQLTQSDNQLGAWFGDTGVRPIGSLGGGFRVWLNKTWVLRLEVRDLVFPARIDSINGCTKDDVSNLENKTAPSSACNFSAFETNPPDQGSVNDALLNAALNQLKNNSSSVVNDLSFYLGASYLF